MDACILWHGKPDTNGYGVRWVNGRRTKAHRHAYSIAFGHIAPGLLIHHVCERKLCVNPAHLVAMSPREHIALHGSMLKAQAIASAERAARTHCKRGHAFTLENTDTYGKGWRRCRACEASRKLGTLSIAGI
jgi:hypothetical protein